MVPHVWLVIDMDDAFNVHAFIDKAAACRWLNDHGYSEIKRSDIFMDSYGRYAVIKEVILHHEH